MFLQAKIVARAGIPRAKLSIRRHSSKFAVVLDEDRRQPHEKKNLTGVALDGEKKSRLSTNNWVPHPRSGIYYPQGQEWVMDDVPKEAASFGKTYWLRTDDDGDIGDEKPDP